MKTVYFVRHAKSSWSDPSLRDKDRPLNGRGKRDAPFMAKLLRGENVHPDQLVASPANRALATATYFAEAFAIEKSSIRTEADIYEAHPAKILEIVRNFDDAWNVVFIFGHNPTFTDVANLFSKHFIDNIPTCGIAKVEANIATWSEFSDTVAEMTAFYYPKQYFT